MFRIRIAALVCFAVACERPLPIAKPPMVAVGAPVPPPPEELFGDLFVAVQTAQIYPDQKTFADATPNEGPETILRLYRAQQNQPGFSLAEFVNRHFTLPTDPDTAPPPNQTLRMHIDSLWSLLTRTTTSVPANSSLVPLPNSYIVPGGRFREGYYWDAYFSMLGLQEAGREDLVDAMLENFAYEIETFGHIPNGNRTYYLSRSQPPFFSFMVTLAAQREGDAVLRKYLPDLRAEYAWWMRGSDGTSPGGAARNVVVLADHTVLNRYWDERDTPRDESYLEDVKTARQSSTRPANEVYRDLRAAAESGWDFSSRWLGDDATLATIRTTSILPVDLNSLLFHLEETIARGCSLTKDTACAAEFTARAGRRAEAINAYLWNENGYYGDYDWRLRRARDDRSAAMLYPLFVGVATPARARRTAQEAATTLLKVGGLTTTSIESGQQWDAPNAWAPLQWIAVVGLQRYGADDLARKIGSRFVDDVIAVYATKQKLVEKYLAEGPGAGTAGGGGEYPTQDGFGWTNGVTLKLLAAFPASQARSRAPRAAVDRSPRSSGP